MNGFMSRVMVQHVSRGAVLNNIWSKQMRSIQTSRQSSTTDPDYLVALKPEVPHLPKIDIVMKGYDFAVLENFQSKAHGLAQTLSLEVVDGWAARAKSLNVTKLKPQSVTIEEEVSLKLYERVLQIDNIPHTKFSILMEVLQAITPPGVNCKVIRHTEDIDKDRYVPDGELKDLKGILKQSYVKKP